MPSARRFPPPWSIEELAECFIVRDANRQALAYVYFEEEPGRRAAAHLLTRDKARRIAANIAKLPELLKQLNRFRKSGKCRSDDAVSHRSRFGPGVKLRGLVCRRGRGGSSYWRFVLQGRLFHCLGDGLLCGRTSRGQIFIWGERNQDGCWRVRRARGHYTKQQHERGNEPHARTGFI